MSAGREAGAINDRLSDPGDGDRDRDAVAGRTFQVSGVSTATTPLPELPYKEAVEALLRPGMSKREWDSFRKAEARAIRRCKPSKRSTEEVVIPKVEACSRYHSRLLADVAYHPVMAAVAKAFAGHRPLRLSPDMIWLMIAQGVANHINAHAEELRRRLVRHEGRPTIEIKRDDFYKGSLENPWPEVFAHFSEAASSHVGPACDLFRAEFSTTGPVERAVLDVVWLDAVQSYFEYSLRSRCGIPEITLEGTPDDWRSIRDRLGRFADLGLDWWWDVLGPILRQFESASRGQADAQFWRSIYRRHGASGGPYITGWIAAFFPYLQDYETGRATRQNGYLLADRDDPEFAGLILFPGDEPEGEDSGGGRAGYGGYPVPGGEGVDADRMRSAWEWGWTTDSLPGGLSRAPFRWLHERDVFPMEFLGGFVGVRQCPDTLALRPEIGWAVRPFAGA